MTGDFAGYQREQNIGKKIKIYVKSKRYNKNRLILKRENPALSSWCFYHKMKSISKFTHLKL
jgi:hypothetical protein